MLTGPLLANGVIRIATVARLDWSAFAYAKFPASERKGDLHDNGPLAELSEVG